MPNCYYATCGKGKGFARAAAKTAQEAVANVLEISTGRTVTVDAATQSTIQRAPEDGPGLPVIVWEIDYGPSHWRRVFTRREAVAFAATAAA